MRARLYILIVTLVVSLSLTAPTAHAEERRIALLIGNQSYDPSVGVLKNPHNDITLVGDALKKQGFEVLPPVKDARRSAILGAVRELTARLNIAGPGAIGFLYYSGHGAAEKDTNINYLIPIDARDPGSTAFWDDSVKLDDVMRLLDGARSAVKFVVFDACRNELQMPTRDTSKGLVPVAEQQGLFVAFASAPGRTASDRGEKSGPYAAALAQEFGHSGLDHLNLFQNVKEAVIRSTGGTQYPWESNGLARRVYLTGEPTTPADLALWDSVKTSTDTASLQRYLDRFPKGLFAATALLIIERLDAEAARVKASVDAQLNAAAAAQGKAAADALRPAREALVAAEQAALDARKLAEPASRPRESTPQIAALTPPPAAVVAPSPGPTPEEMARRLQTELMRVGCFSENVDGRWGAQSRKALAKFIQTTGLDLPAEDPSMDAVAAVAGQRGRICPPECRKSEVERAGKCVQQPTAAPAPTNPVADPPSRPAGPPKSAPVVAKAARPEPTEYSLNYWPRNSLKLGQTVTANTPFGRLTCLAKGTAAIGAASSPITRPCSWN